MDQDKICSLMYHDAYITSKAESGFDFDSANSYKITKEQFEEHIASIDKYLSSKRISKDYVRFTFDDGGISFLTVYAPILEKYGFCGYFFIATKYIDTPGFLTRNQIKELQLRGHVIAGHSHSHRQRMNTLSREELKMDWHQCLETLKGIIGTQIKVASLPNGFCSDVMLDVLNELGITEIYTSEPFENVKMRKGCSIYGRYGIKDNMSCQHVLNIIFSKSTKRKLYFKKRVLGFAKKLLGGWYVKIREIIYTQIICRKRN